MIEGDVRHERDEEREDPRDERRRHPEHDGEPAHQHDPPVHQLGEVGGVAGGLGQLPQHLVDLWRPVHRRHQVTEPAGDLHAESILAAGSPDQIALIGERADEVVRRRQRDVTPVGDLFGVQPLWAVADLLQNPERPRDALDQIGRPPRQHLNRSPAAAMEWCELCG